MKKFMILNILISNFMLFQDKDNYFSFDGYYIFNLPYSYIFGFNDYAVFNALEFIK